MNGEELTFTEAGGPSHRPSNDKHLSTVIANGRPVLTADVELAAALARAVLEVTP